MLLADDLTQLLDVLPTFISGPLEKHPRREQLVRTLIEGAGLCVRYGANKCKNERCEISHQDEVLFW